MESKENRDKFAQEAIDLIRRGSNLPAGIGKYAYDLFREELDRLYYPDLIILPLTPEGEIQREWLINYHHDKQGRIIHQSILRYGAHEREFKYQGDDFIAMLVNND